MNVVETTMTDTSEVLLELWIELLEQTCEVMGDALSELLGDACVRFATSTAADPDCEAPRHAG